MLLRRRSPGIPTRPPDPAEGFEYLDRQSLGVLRWLADNRIDYVLVGPVARALRGAIDAAGPVAIVPAPYRRNYQRLCGALWTARGRLRNDAARPGEPETLPLKLTPERLAGGARWTLRCGVHDIDVEPSAPHGSGTDAGTSRYQELLYEANRFELAAGVSVEVASPEDIEHFDYMRVTGLAPEIRISRQAPLEHPAGLDQHAPGDR
ncbi:MAG: hypothetical protein M3018_13325 [Actinomycetota bacterium]|nr:hypothetical protein [Actinomycetota bacterium]